MKNKINELFEEIDLRKIFKEGFYFLTFLIFLIILCLINFCFTGQFFPSNETKDLWFWSGLVMILFTNYFIEPYYTAPTNVFANSFALVLMMISIPQNEFGSTYWWWAGTIFFSILLFGSFLSKIIYNKNKSDDFIINKISNHLKEVLVLIGRGKILFSFVLFYFLFINFSDNSLSNGYTLTLFVFWAIVVLLSPEDIKKFIDKTFLTGDEVIKNKSLGKIFAVQSDGMFLVRLFDNKITSKFSTVIFQNQISRDKENFFSVGFIFDIYFLDNEKWAKVVFVRKMTDEEDRNINRKDFKKDFVYRTDMDYIPREIENFAGVIVEGSEVGRIKFEYSEKTENLEEGDLLELYVRGKKVFYQVTNGDTHKEKLESWNESGFIIGQALQLGKWHNDLSFEQFGWVPAINTPLFKASTEKEESEVGEIKYPEYKLGIIPRTKLPSVINLEHAVSHHMAVLGVTGSGKSFFVRDVIKEIKHKTIIVDLTSEWKKEISEPELLNGGNLETFLNDDSKKLGIIELTAMSGTGEVLSQVQKALEKVFDHAKTKYNGGTPANICIVLEEAHTIVPETSFLGELGDYGANKAIVNKLAQIALQGRKYGVGLLVIGQRSANISKTVLTQCNTIVAFKAFDDTNFGFLTNYIGKNLVSVIPTLKQYHAVVVGKAIKSKVPMIIDFTKPQNET